MKLPDHILSCIRALKEAGFSAYAVGGCVRDALLGLEPHDYDLCTDALPEQTEAVFSHRKLVLAGKKHGTVGVVTERGVVEITTFRTEGTYRDHRHPDRVDFVSNLREDLARRDFTVNAMAYDPDTGLADPFGGQQDLRHRVLRAVGDPDTRFREDALRILRGVRFAVRYGLETQEDTAKAMVRQRHLLDSLARERVFDELCKLLPLMAAGDLLRFAPVLAAAIPELEPMIGFQQHSPHHAYDLFTHTAFVTAQVPADGVLRWAALLHDTGKVDTFTQDENGRGHFYGHAAESARIADSVLARLKAPGQLRRQAVILIDRHMLMLEPDRKLLRRWASRLGMDTLKALVDLQEADMGSKGTGKPQDTQRFRQIRRILADLEQEKPCLSLKDLAIDGHDLMALGLEGPRIGQCLNRLLEQVLEDPKINTKPALLAAADAYRKEQSL